MTNTGFQGASLSHQRNFFILKPDVAKMKVITDIQATGATNFISFVLLQLTVGGMKSLGIAGYYPDQLHQTLCGAKRLHNHLNPYVL